MSHRNESPECLFRLTKQSFISDTFTVSLFFLPISFFLSLFLDTYHRNPLLEEACFPDETLLMTRANGRISMYYESSEALWNDDETF